MNYGFKNEHEIVRELNYKNWGYDNYYGLLDEKVYTDLSYELDRELMLNEPNIITEASFIYDNNFCSVDILKNDCDGVEIYEIKSSTKIKDIYTPVKAITLPDTRGFICNIKSINLISAVTYAQKAKCTGVYEAILYREGGRVTECSHSNVHIITKNVIFPTDMTVFIDKEAPRRIIANLHNCKTNCTTIVFKFVLATHFCNHISHLF